MNDKFSVMQARKEQVERNKLGNDGFSLALNVLKDMDEEEIVEIAIGRAKRELNFCVRNGNRWNLPAIITGLELVSKQTSFASLLVLLLIFKW